MERSETEEGRKRDIENITLMSTADRARKKDRKDRAGMHVQAKQRKQSSHLSKWYKREASLTVSDSHTHLLGECNTAVQERRDHKMRQKLDL